MNKEELRKFVTNLSSVMPISSTRNKEIVINTATDHIWGKIYKKEIDFKKALSWLIDSCEKSHFPDIPTIEKSLRNAEVKPFYRECLDEGSLLVVTLASGFTYEFTVSGIGKSMDELKADIKRKFGDCTYKFYPKGTVIIGGEVFMP